MALLVQAACRSPEPRPSVLLFVLDTVRVDAVSAYGKVQGTTPALDELAARGLRYSRAYSNSPWTLPSHVTLFTGLPPQVHGVDWGQLRAADSLDTLAERLRRAGYETIAVSENPWVSDSFNVTQGFDRFTSLNGSAEELHDTLASWTRDRDRNRPFFLFVNVVDAHWPYAVRERNAFLPPGVTKHDAAEVSQWPPGDFCAQSPPARDLAIKYGLYLGDVAAADAKLRLVRDLMAETDDTANLITIVTSDHGEHFGEHGLAHHQFSLHEPLLHVPLIVEGLRGVAPAVVDAPVQLADVTPAILAWLRLPGVQGPAGSPLPTRADDPAPARDLIARFVDPDRQAASGDSLLATLGRSQALALRSQCGPEDRVWGDMRSLVRYPYKLIWYERYPAELYDLEKDPGELENLAARETELTQELLRALERATSERPAPRSAISWLIR